MISFVPFQLISDDGKIEYSDRIPVPHQLHFATLLSNVKKFEQKKEIENITTKMQNLQTVAIQIDNFIFKIKHMVYLGKICNLTRSPSSNSYMCKINVE